MSSSRSVATPALARAARTCAFVGVILVCGGGSDARAQVVLNEVVASNQSVLADEDGDYSDWIELYNLADAHVDLSGYGLSDTSSDLYRWTFPAVSVAPGGFLVVWVSGKDRSAVNRPLHASFSIAAAGEQILLTRPDGVLSDELPPTAIPPDVSFGRQPDGTGSWRYFTSPTPGATNATGGVAETLSAPSFSHEAGFHQGEIAVTLMSPEDGAIHYTLDGSEPTITSPVYQEPIRITSREGEPNDISLIRTYYHVKAWRPPDGEVYKGTVIRARVFKPDAIASPPAVRSFFVAPAGRARYSLPVVSVGAERDALFDFDAGIYVPGAHYRSGDPWSGNYFQRGDEWERPVTIEMFDTVGPSAFTLHAGVRIHGGFSRAVPYKTLRIYARSEYDTQNWIEYPIFPDRQVRRFKRLLLRNAGNDWGGHPWATYNLSEPGTLIRDAMMQRLVEHLNIDTQGYRPAILFINGEYWGIHNFRQRYDRFYLESNYGLQEGEVDFLTDDRVVVEGSRSHFDWLMTFVSSARMDDQDALRQVAMRMDLDNFLDYYIANIYFDNTDWPHKNIDYWRFRRDGVNPGAAPGRDGRWRWMLYDTDFGFGLGGDHNPGAGPARNTLAHALRNDNSTLLFRRLLLNSSVREDFINRYADHLNSIFSSPRVLTVIDSMQATLEPEMPEHLRRWRYPSSIERWNQNVEVLRDFARRRPAYAREHVRQQLGLAGTWTLTVDVSDPVEGYVQVNRLQVRPGAVGVPEEPFPWSGVYFQRVPISVTPIPNQGYRFIRWEGGDGPSEERMLVLDCADSRNVFLRAVFAPDDGEPGAPTPHRLVEAPYSFTTWSADAPAQTYPPHMHLMQTSTRDPQLDDEMESLWRHPYNLESRSRFVGLNEFGLGFINTSAPQEDGGGYAGAAVLALDTRGVDSTFVTWTGATPRPNSRGYALRLQYRTDSSGLFEDVIDDDGQPVEYRRSGVEGHMSTIGPHPLPQQAVDKPHVEVRWKYYFTGEQYDLESGQRSMIRLADVRVTSTTSPTGATPSGVTEFRLLGNYPNPFGENTTISYALPHAGHVQVKVFDILGREVAILLDAVQPPGRHSIEWDSDGLPSGVYLYSIRAADVVLSGLMMRVH